MWFSKKSRHLRKNYHDLWHEATLKVLAWIFLITGPLVSPLTEAIQHSYKYIDGEHPNLWPQQTFMISVIAFLIFSLLSFLTDLAYKRVKGVRVERDNPEPKKKATHLV